MFLYRILLALAVPFFAFRLWREGGDAARQRLGGDSGGVRRGAVIWLHAASNGELTAARPLIGALLARDPRLTCLVTCNSATGLDLLHGWGVERLEARLAPLDYRIVLRRFIGGWQPDLLILIENELWPNRMTMMQALRRPVVVLSARMSARSAARWGRLPGLARTVMQAITWLSAQDSASAARFLSLGLPEERLGEALNLKTGAAPGDFDTRERDTLSTVLPRTRTVLAASTHEGEEAGLLRGFVDAQSRTPELRLILAPRHPRRGPEIAALVQRTRLPFATRSAGEKPGRDTVIYLADTLGEMPLWYELAGIVFVGGSLAPRGGHTPFEPAAHGCALLHGPHLENFAEIYAALEAAQASIRIDGASTFTRALLRLDPAVQKELASRAADVIDEHRNDAGLAPLLDKMAELTGDTDLRRK